MRLPEDARALIRHAIEDHDIDDETCYNLICSLMTIVAQTAYHAGRADQLETTIKGIRITAND